jgi:peptide/nickel transport system ATP-binding protein/oligopeptide transport system ATP-binding protein
MALALSPRLLIADEPTTALDVTVQAQIMDLLTRLRAEEGMSLLLITHDLGVVAGVADRVVLMYAGRVVETGAVREVYEHTGHPYTAGLLGSVPVVDGPRERLIPIQGSPPDLLALPSGCSFRPRCHSADALCAEQEPELRVLTSRPTTHQAACHHPEGALTHAR